MCSDVISGLSTKGLLSYQGQDDVASVVERLLCDMMKFYHQHRLTGINLVVIYMWCTCLVHKTFCCVPTQGLTTVPPDVPPECCPALEQTTGATAFRDGVMTFTYNDDDCKTTVVAVCTQTDAILNLYVAIVANGQYFLDVGPNSVSFPGTCNTTDQTWLMGQPPLTIDTIECRLTNPP